MGWDDALFMLPNQQMQTLKHFECPLCYEVVKNAVGCACGHTFCKDSLKLALNSTRVQLVRVRDDDDPRRLCRCSTYFEKGGVPCLKETSYSEYGIPNLRGTQVGRICEDLLPVRPRGTKLGVAKRRPTTNF